MYTNKGGQNVPTMRVSEEKVVKNVKFVVNFVNLFYRPFIGKNQYKAINHAGLKNKNK